MPLNQELAAVDRQLIVRISSSDAFLIFSVHPNDVLTMVYRHLGIDPADHTVNLDGRPIPILPDGQPIRELV